jgi:hypothetical protein
MDRGRVGWRRNFVGPGAGDFPGRGGLAAAAGAWLGRPLAGPTLESGCRGHEPGWCPRGTAGRGYGAVDRAVCLGRVPGGGPGGDGSGVVLTSSFEVEILRLCRRLRPGRVSPKVGSAPRVPLLPLLMSDPAETFYL